ncbi:protein EFR3 homolog cmp44E isoform X2 [Frankliniella occidentalis]|uniref:Protein EFR3 homolog cmp44E isoform X2 n=1 Tax=Frankliniella occidentalis TaxID=133901 RepID=A0A9C6X764_FRAOC|nr:protein EFR3 homolog cmp44E isoform X2 [Frankliniella occidentalis]
MSDESTRLYDRRTGCCWCCSALRPRYKRLVDNIFPVNPQDGLIKNNMEKLTFYALSSPEKLDRIGEYLYQKAARDIYRRRNGLVVIAMEAMDQLLLACHAQTLNLFVESFLKMVQKLLESTEPQLQILATQSFVRFANIEEDTPSYHRRYDFFVSKFSAMCHSNHTNRDWCNQIRLAGIRGLQGVVRKTVSDDLVENIWEPVHMDKIMPSLLYNMQNARYPISQPGSPAPHGEEDRQDPPTLAESCMRELVGRASFGHIKSVLRPVLRHLDLHKLWVPNEFAIHAFKIIMFSIQSQYSYTVVETLMAHLDDNSTSSPEIRTSIADVLSKIIAIAAGESVGPSVLEIINSLLNHLRVSVSKLAKAEDSARHKHASKDDSTHEKLYQEALINALGEFANHLPDYQKIEIMMFIMSKVPHSEQDGDVLLQSMLLKSLLKVGTKYQTIQLNQAFPVNFLERLLRMSVGPNPDMRLLVNKIFHTLLDRHLNLEKLLKPTVDVDSLKLTVTKSSRLDAIFIRKHGGDIFLTLYESLELPSNTVENIEAAYTTTALICIELVCEESVCDLLRLIMSIQDLALTSSKLSLHQKYQLHAVVASLLALVPHCVPLSSLQTYADKIIATRIAKAPYLLPPLMRHYDSTTVPAGDVLLDQPQITSCLAEAGLDATQMARPHTGSLQHRHSWVDSGMGGSAAELNSMEVDSVSSSPGVVKKFPEEELTFESLKRILSPENVESRKEADEEKRLRLCETYRSASFTELVQHTQSKGDILNDKLNQLLKGLATKQTLRYLSERRDTERERERDDDRKSEADSEEERDHFDRHSPHSHSRSHSSDHLPPAPQPLYETLFPELFVY